MRRPRSEHFRDNAAILVSVGGALLVIGGVFTAIGSVAASSTAQTAGKPLDLLGNDWFDLGIGCLLVGFVLVITGALYLTPRFAGPRLTLVYGPGEEFNVPLGKTTAQMEAAAGVFGKPAVAGLTVRVRVDETRGVLADDVQVRLAAVSPPQDAVPEGESLIWRSGGRFGRVPPKGFDYVTFFDQITLVDGTKAYGGPFLALANKQLGDRVKVTLEAHWHGRRMASLDIDFNKVDEPGSNPG
jgi:hypothetical protein